MRIFALALVGSVLSACGSNKPAPPPPPPAAPTGLAATGGNAQISLTWTAVSGATSYIVFRGDASGGEAPLTPPATPSAAAFTDTGLTAGKTYFYVVQAKNNAGTSGNSNEASAATIPAPPTGVSAVGGTAQVALSWTAAAGATSYVVSRGTASGGPYSQIGTPAATSYTDTAVTAGTTYYYVVQSVGSSGASANSTEASAAPGSPGPTGLVATGGVGQVALTWTAGTGASGYAISRGTISGGPYTQIGTSSTASFTDTTVAGGTVYYYVVQSIAGGINSAYSTEVNALTAPSAPTGLTATPASTHVDLTWTASTGASSYDVLRAPGGTTTFAVVGSTTTATALRDGGLTPGTAYAYVVRAKNASGTSANSSPIQNVTTAPPAPTGVTLTSGNAKVALSWTVSPGATGYDVLRSTSSSSGFTSIGKPTGTSLTDTAVTNGVSYYYIVRATSSAGSSDDAGPFTGTPHREICVADLSTNIISVFNAEQTGNVAPLRTYGSLTGMAGVNGVAVDTSNGEYFVSNSATQTITAYSRLSNGNKAPVRTLTGVRGGIAFDFASQALFVVFPLGSVGSQVLVFARTASGNASPQQTLNLPSGVQGARIALQPAANGKMFVADGTKIYVYLKSDSGTTVPSATITSTSIGHINAIAYDPTADEIIVANRSGFTASILTFSSTANGATTPSRTLSGSNTLYQSADDLAVDAVNNILYVVDHISAEVFAFPRAFVGTANVAPSWTLLGASTQLSSPYSGHLAVDVVNNELIVLNSSNRVLVFGRTASGNTAPTRAISGADTGIDSPNGLRFDPIHGEIFVANNGQNPGITVHAQTATGDAQPIRSLGGANLNTGLSGGVQDVELDLAHGELFAASASTPSVNIWARTASGDVAPARSIAGGNTGLAAPVNLAFDSTGDAIVVTEGNRIDTFARSFTNGNELPLTVISGAATGLVSLQGIFVDVTNNEIASGQFSGAISFFGRTATGNAAPLRTFNSNLGGYVFVDAAAGEIFSTGSGSIGVYARTANGGTPAALRTISGSATGLYSAQGIALCN
jgi:fibronectin type 3 domain-containing protein